MTGIPKSIFGKVLFAAVLLSALSACRYDHEKLTRNRPRWITINFTGNYPVSRAIAWRTQVDTSDGFLCDKIECNSMWGRSQSSQTDTFYADTLRQIKFPLYWTEKTWCGMAVEYAMVEVNTDEIYFQQVFNLGPDPCRSSSDSAGRKEAYPEKNGTTLRYTCGREEGWRKYQCKLDFPHYPGATERAITNLEGSTVENWQFNMEIDTPGGR